jgi:hypothetical protein
MVESITLKEETDALVWCYESSGVYSSSSLYSINGFRDISPIYIPTIWNIIVPPKIQLFLLLVSQNKLATVDNLYQKGMGKPTQCCLCDENESIRHLFFKCTVVTVIWCFVREYIGLDVGNDYISVASKWMQKEMLLRRMWKLTMEERIIYKEAKMEEMVRWFFFWRR